MNARRMDRGKGEAFKSLNRVSGLKEGGNESLHCWSSRSKCETISNIFAGCVSSDFDDVILHLIRPDIWQVWIMYVTAAASTVLFGWTSLGIGQATSSSSITFESVSPPTEERKLGT